ncbi:unnamed protein product [Linum trigynum]|uniref:Uncharacterized protein n=1 Tax=Linum trigynum TaxID=586398 RepID=A0AAV2FYE7_9ROSI
MGETSSKPDSTLSYYQVLIDPDSIGCMYVSSSSIIVHPIIKGNEEQHPNLISSRHSAICMGVWMIFPPD